VEEQPGLTTKGKSWTIAHGYDSKTMQRKIEHHTRKKILRTSLMTSATLWRCHYANRSKFLDSDAH
jgi:hypothetical protein